MSEATIFADCDVFAPLLCFDSGIFIVQSNAAFVCGVIYFRFFFCLAERVCSDVIDSAALLLFIFTPILIAVSMKNNK